MRNMNNRAAIIDLGTNTFHMLIVEWENGVHHTIYKLQVPVKLGRGGFDTKLIRPDAYLRGISAIREFKNQMNSHGVSRLYAYGTSTLRSTTNGPKFQEEIEAILKAPILTISGDEEAELIYLGVRQAVKLGHYPHLIMDIGGGSVEFIIADDEKIYWQKSYEIGAARLLEKFHHVDPIDSESITLIEDYLEIELQELWEVCENYKVHTLVGASGTFESLAEIDMNVFHTTEMEMPFIRHEISMEHFREISNRIIRSNREDLYQVPGLALFRVELIVVATILIKKVVDKIECETMIASDYALKEGVMFQMMEEVS